MNRGLFARVGAPMAVALVLLSLPACGRFARRSDAPPSSAPPVSYGDGATLPPSLIGTPAASKKTGRIEVTVIDDRNRVLSGAIVRVKGPRTMSRATNSRGVAAFTVPPGEYLADVAPCGTTVITDTYGSSRVTVGRGQTSKGPIDGIKWHLRYRPEGAVTTSRKPPWPRGTDVTLGVRITDGCDISNVARGVSIASYRWTTSSNFSIVRAATVTNARGFAEIVVRCTSAGDGSIVIRHRSDAADYVDLLLAGSQPAAGSHWCA